MAVPVELKIEIIEFLYRFAEEGLDEIRKMEESFEEKKGIEIGASPI